MLAATVSSFIHNGEPVSSQDLSNYFGLSSATIRHILSELEEEGYLMQQHTSAGRTPTDKGYRYYVDFLMAAFKLSDDQRHDILNEFKKQASSLDDILEKASEMIARLTHYTAIISFYQWEDRIFYSGLSNIVKEPEFRDSDKLIALIKLLEEKRQLLHIMNQDYGQPIKVFIGNEISFPQLNESCSLVVSTFQKNKKDKGKIAVLGPRRMSYNQTVSTLEFITDTLNHMFDDL